jgi:hypothetical protein
LIFFQRNWQTTLLSPTTLSLGNLSEADFLVLAIFFPAWVLTSACRGVAQIGEEALPFVLRTACLRLMLFLHVDSDPWEETLLPRTSRLLHDYTGGGASAESAARLQHKNSLRGSTGRIKDLRDVLVKYLKVMMPYPG